MALVKTFCGLRVYPFDLNRFKLIEIRARILEIRPSHSKPVKPHVTRYEFRRLSALAAVPVTTGN